MDLQQQQWIDQQADFNDFEILDVRTPDEYEEGHIPKLRCWTSTMRQPLWPA